MERRQRAVYIEDHKAITVRDLRKSVRDPVHAKRGRQVFTQLERCTVHIGERRAVTVELVRLLTNLGHVMVLPRCPTCARVVRVLRVVPYEPGLGCARCLRERVGARYRSQDV